MRQKEASKESPHFQNPLFQGEHVPKVRCIGDLEVYQELRDKTDVCSGCGMHFSSTNRPRVLLCSHTVCEYCILRKA